MGLSQSSEASEGGTYGYHVHGVRLTELHCFEAGAAYLDMLLTDS